ncbi:MAG TPA: MFS transporter, partial [Actinomycetota bacterium]
RSPTLVPRTLASTLFFQRFIHPRGLQRWLAHQAMFWGVILAAAVTFPLTFGWIHFRATPGTQHDYTLYFLGVRATAFDAFGAVGWLMFHALDIAAVLVIAGAAYFLLHRVRDRRVLADQAFLRDLFPLLALLAVAVTGLLLTFSAAFLAGRSYHLLALVHMSTVVLTLLFIPFGKFFHVIHRTATSAVPVYQATSLAAGGAFECRRCGAPLEAAAFVGDLQKTMGELRLDYPAWVETCPRCKRLERGDAYRRLVKAGFE